MKLYVVVEAADGYRAVFALAEFDPDFTDRVMCSRTAATAIRYRPRRGRSGSWFPARSVMPGGCGR